LAVSHTRCEQLEASLHAADVRARNADLEWGSKCSDLEATLGDEQAKRKSAEGALQQMRDRVGELSSASAMARNEMGETSRRHRAEMQALRESLHSELLAEQAECENAAKRETELQMQLERVDQELAETKAALSRTVESHARVQGDTRSSSEDALLQESMRVKSAELSAARARQALADKEDELAQVSAQLQDVMAELSQAHDEAKIFHSSSNSKMIELAAQVRDVEKRSAAREQEWVEKTGHIVSQAATLKQERDAMQAELADAHRLNESETTMVAALRAEATSCQSELANARALANEAAEAAVQAREVLREELGGQISSLKLEMQDARARTQAAERDAQTA
jgi:predicted  nucleic acid-binding Zn-ribbon protein